MDIDLIATKRVRYGGKVYQPGESFKAKKRYARVLVEVLKNAEVASATKRARKSKSDSPPAIVTPEPPAPPVIPDTAE